MSFSNSTHPLPVNIHEISRLNIDVFALANHFGSRTALHQALLEAGHDDLLRATLDKWFDRRRIPLKWLISILTVAASMGAPVDPYSLAVPPGYSRIEDCPAEERERYLNSFGKTLRPPSDSLTGG